MKNKVLIRTVIILLMLALNVGCDQFTKAIVRKKLPYEQPVSYLHDHFLLIRTENTGAFLSLANTLVNPYRYIFLNLLPALALFAALVFVFIRTNLTGLRLIAVILILGGGTGNIYDRITNGSVTDFLFIQFPVFRTGVFNVADVSITTGIILLFITTWAGQRRYVVEDPEYITREK